jgi:acetyl esterase/lipase
MKSLKLVFALFILASSCFAQTEPKVFNLYPNGVPNSKPAPVDYVERNNNNSISRVTEPTLTAYLPAGGASGSAIVIIPGGGYSGIANGHEGIDVAKRFAENGVAAFLLKYRLPSDLIMNDRSIGPLQDAQRAIQMVRERASEWKVDTNKIGVLGFSAGGHLASTLGTHYNKALIDNKLNTKLRPDFMALIYPVITMGEFTHGGSKKNLIGSDATAEQMNLYSNQLQVDANTPPTFLVHAQNDNVVSIQNPLIMYQALVKAGVKAEMHLYQAGGHGFGMNNKTTTDPWFERCINWLKTNDFLPK